MTCNNEMIVRVGLTFTASMIGSSRDGTSGIAGLAERLSRPFRFGAGFG
jgi:hypothetical protein